MAKTRVTRETYCRAESDRTFHNATKLAGGVNRFFHFRDVTPLDRQTVVRMNRDTLYSPAVVDTSKGATITVPQMPDGRYCSVLMIANDLNRHSRGDRHVKLNPDGTVTLRLSHDTTGKAEDTNFLPVPNEGFYLVLRIYGGDEDIQAGRFPVPVVQKVGK